MAKGEGDGLNTCYNCGGRGLAVEEDRWGRREYCILCGRSRDFRKGELIEVHPATAEDRDSIRRMKNHETALYGKRRIS